MVKITDNRLLQTSQTYTSGQDLFLEMENGIQKLQVLLDISLEKINKTKEIKRGFNLLRMKSKEINAKVEDPLKNW